MKLGFDIDGVTFDIMTPLISQLSIKINRELEMPKQASFDIVKSYKLTSDEERIFIATLSRLLQSTNIQPFTGALLFIKSYYKHTNLTPVFVTGRSSKYIDSTYSLLEKNLSDIPFRVYHLSSEEKYKAIVNEGVKVFVEDRRKTAIDLAGRELRVFLMDSPWNRKMEEHENITRVWSWFDVGIRYAKYVKEEKTHGRKIQSGG